MNEIYVVMHAYYSDWHIHGFFTRREDADKWVATHAGQDEIVVVVECLDNKVDYSNITLKYEHEVVFDKRDGSWKMREEPDRYKVYIADYLRSNMVKNSTHMVNPWVSFKVNIVEDNRKRAEKIAQDMLYQYLDFCNGTPTDDFSRDMNYNLSEAERKRAKAKAEEELKNRELAELARLKEKYEF